MKQNQILSLFSDPPGVSVLVTQISAGFAVTVLDQESGGFVLTSVFPPPDLEKALTFAHSCIP
jgi:hypothetical protein